MKEAIQKCNNELAKCVDKYDYTDEIVGQCYVCGVPVDATGCAVMGCRLHSTCVCEECGYSPCVGNCVAHKETDT